MSAVAEWAAMGGYAGWVWGAWGVTTLCVGALTLLILRDSARTRARLAALEAEMAQPPRHGDSAP
ncbi:heme exporter protein CcmD [Hyphomonadaceae bacterium BL14]|nr:heme exporter protein CcmD [Hyphomonadaceae bacterium BL14]